MVHASSALPSNQPPRGRLLNAALTGLVGAGALACGGNDGEPDPCVEVDAGTPEHDAGAADVGADTGDDGGYHTTSTELGPRSYEELAELCRTRGGYLQVHGGCSGVNACAGFSYGDWGDEAALTEHTCAGMNGCNGLSCVYMAPDEGRTGQEVYEAALPETGPRRCATCHTPSSFDEASGEYVPDHTIFRVKVPEGSARTPQDWTTTRSADEMERMLAFGASGFANGEATAHMASYRRIFSRAEIERVVEYLRGFPADRVEISTYAPTGSSHSP
jgi:hypothetical protein